MVTSWGKKFTVLVGRDSFAGLLYRCHSRKHWTRRAGGLTKDLATLGVWAWYEPGSIGSGE